MGKLMSFITSYDHETLPSPYSAHVAWMSTTHEY